MLLAAIVAGERRRCYGFSEGRASCALAFAPLELAVAEKLVYRVPRHRRMWVHLHMGSRRLRRSYHTTSKRVQCRLLACRHNVILSGIRAWVHRVIGKDCLCRRRILQVGDLSTTHAIGVPLCRSIVEHH